MKGLHTVLFVLVIVGALNWGLLGLFDYNLVSAIFGNYPVIERLVYLLVGAGGVYMLVAYKDVLKSLK